MKLTIKKYHAVAAWRWEVEEECCIICRSPFDGCCPDCKYPGDDCPPVWGKCDHSFHIHCILKWLQTHSQEQCPLCRRPWQFK